MPTPIPLNAAAFHEKFKAEPQPVAGKNILLTGGTTGIGRAIAMLLVARGANVFTFGRNQKDLDQALAEVKSVGGGWIGGTTADSSKPEDVERVFGEAEKAFGGPTDIVINNAALAANSVLDMEVKDIRTVLDVNLLGYVLVARLAAQRMKKRKQGTIVFVGSMSAKVREEGSDVYVATKSGIRGFADSLAKSLNPAGVRVSLIEPGLVGSDMTVDQVEPKDQPKKIEEMKMLRAEELAQCVLYVLEQPARCDVALIQLRPTKQII